MSYTDSAGNTAYNWGYSPSQSTGEDSNHASLDVAGFYRAYMIGRYGITAAQMTTWEHGYAEDNARDRLQAAECVVIAPLTAACSP